MVELSNKLPEFQVRIGELKKKRPKEKKKLFYLTFVRHFYPKSPSSWGSWSIDQLSLSVGPWIWMYLIFYLRILSIKIALPMNSTIYTVTKTIPWNITLTVYPWLSILHFLSCPLVWHSSSKVPTPSASSFMRNKSSSAQNVPDSLPSLPSLSLFILLWLLSYSSH